MFKATLSIILNRVVLISFLVVYQLLAPLLEFEVFPFSEVLWMGAGLSLISLLFYGLLVWRQTGTMLEILFYAQFITDICFVSSLVLLTGGLDSKLYFGYFIVILISAVYTSKIQIYMITILSFCSYYLVIGVLPVSLVYGWDAFDLYLIPQGVVLSAAGNFVLFFSTALAGGFLQEVYHSDKLRLRMREKSLRLLRNLHRKIVEGLHSGVLTCDDLGQIQFVNSAAERLLARNQTELLQLNVAEVLDQRLDDMPLAPGDEGLFHCDQWLKIEGKRRLFGISQSKIELETGHFGYLFLFQDLTHIRMLEDQKRLEDRMVAIGKMASGVAHEIRNPLASISGSVQVLRELIPDDPAAIELADIVNKETARLNNIISEFLTYTRPRESLNLVPLNLVEVFEHFRSLVLNDQQYKDRSLDMVVKGKREEMFIEGDESKLTQIFWNLIRNSFQASPSEAPIEVIFCTKEDEVWCCIEDQGKGMTPEQLDELFTPFRSFSKAGTGLGMAIVYEIMQWHRGKIQAHSQEGKGTQILLQFPKIKGTA